jgi:hypothetical protein
MENIPQENKISATLKKVFFVILGLLVLLNFFILPHEPHFGLDKYTGFWAVFGCVIAVVLARLAKGAAHTFLGKDEDFYVKKQETGISS